MKHLKLLRRSDVIIGYGRPISHAQTIPASSEISVLSWSYLTRTASSQSSINGLHSHTSKPLLYIVTLTLTYSS
jgi:hypothetical protein